MALPATVSTQSWSDHKNSLVGPYPRINRVMQDTSNVNASLGNDNQHEALMQVFKATANGSFPSFDAYLSKVGSPTDNLIAKVYLFDNLGDTIISNFLLAISIPVVGSTLSTTAAYRRFAFPAPAVIDLATDEYYAVTIERSGTIDSSNYYLWTASDTNPYADGKAKVSQSQTWVNISNTDLRFRANMAVSGRYTFGIDKTNNKIRCSKSTDNLTWTEQDSANAPAVSSTANLKSVSTAFQDTKISVFVITSSTRLDIFNFDTSNDTWGSSAFNTTSPTFNTNISGVAPLVAGFRSTSFLPSALSDYLFLNNGATESVMGNARRRVKISRRLISDGTWSVVDVSGLGQAIDYDARMAIMDGNGLFHIFHTGTDSTSIVHTSYSLTNTLSSANSLNSATCDSTTAYPIGIPCNFMKSSEWWLAVPFVISGQLKVSRCKASISGTSANWTNTAVGTTTIETTNSNPCVLVADNENGGRIFAFFIKTDGKIYYSHDKGNDDWISEREFRPGTKTVTGLSAAWVADALGIAYFDTSPTPDELRYDQIEVYFPKDVYTNPSSLVQTRDVTVSGSYIVQSDTDETANVIVTTRIYRSTAQGETPQLQSTSETQGGGEFSETTIDPGILVRIEVDVSGADATFGTIGM